MRIIFVNRYFHPDQCATSQMLTDLAFDLAAGGLGVAVVTSRQRLEDPRAALPVHEHVRGVEVFRVRSSRFGRRARAGRLLDYLSFHLFSALRLARICRAGDVVVAKTDPPLLSVVAGWLARRCGASHVNWLHDLFPEVAEALGVRGLGGWIGAALGRARNRSLVGASMNVVLGDGMAERLEALGVGTDRIRVIHNWCDGEAVRPRPVEGHPLRRQWGLERCFVVGYSGNLGLAHEFETILGAAAALRDEHRFAFLLIGGGLRLDAVRARVAALGLGNVTFKPYQPRERLELSLTVPDVHLVSLRPELEGLVVPSKVYGIAAAGRPAIHIGSRDGEVARLLQDMGFGCTVAAGDAPGLVKAIRELADDTTTCRVLGASAREAFERRFAMPVALSAWRDVLTNTR